MSKLEWIKKNEDSIIFFTKKNKPEMDNKKAVKVFIEAFGELISTANLLKKYNMEEIKDALSFNFGLVFQYIDKGEIDRIITFVNNVLKIRGKLSKINKEIEETLKGLTETFKRREELGNIWKLESDEMDERLNLNELNIELYQSFKYLEKKKNKLIRSLFNILFPLEYLWKMDGQRFSDLMKDKSDSLLIKKKQVKNK